MAESKPTFEIGEVSFRRARCLFVEKMNNIPGFLDRSLSLGFFTYEHKNLVLAEKGESDQIRKVHDYLKGKIFDHPNNILEALVKSGNPILAMELLPRGTKVSDLEQAFNVKIDLTESKYRIENFTGNCVEFIKYMSGLPNFIDYALQKNLLSTQDKNKIECKKNVDDRTRTLCDIMVKKLPGKSDDFLYALKRSGNEYLVELLLTGTGVTFDIVEFDSTKAKSSIDGLYPMENRGRVVIMENMVFDNPEEFREGSDKDREAVETFFTERNFEVILKRDLTAEQMERELKVEINDEKGVSEDIFILFIMSHGCEGAIRGTDSETMNYSVIFKCFEECPKWKDKPKLIYIQACQNKEGPNIASHIRTDGHIYTMFSTIPGGTASRFTDAGSIFIQSVIDIYRDKSETEDVDAMGLTIREKIYNFPGCEKKQIALCYSSLVKRVYLQKPA